MIPIILITDGFGPSYGGINSFNYDLSLALGKYFIGIVKTINIIITEDFKKAENNRNEGTIDIYEYKKDAFEDHEMVRKLLEKANCGKENPVWWIGHDVISGNKALSFCKIARKNGFIHSQCAIFHHMNYQAYQDLKSYYPLRHEILSDEELTKILNVISIKEENQINILNQVDKVFSIGPLLTISALEKLHCEDNPKTTEPVELIPGLANIKPLPFDKIKDFKHIISYGRIDEEIDVIKQFSLAVMGFSQYQSNVNSDKSKTLKLYGLNKEIQNYLRKIYSICEETGGYITNIHGRLYTKNRKRLWGELRTSIACLMLSLHEGFGLVGWEAIACEVPLILTENSGLFQFLKKKGNEYIALCKHFPIKGSTKKRYPFRQDDLNNVVNYIEEILLNLKEAKMDAHKLRDNLKEYTWKKTARDFLNGLDITAANDNNISLTQIINNGKGCALSIKHHNKELIGRETDKEEKIHPRYSWFKELFHSVSPNSSDRIIEKYFKLKDDKKLYIPGSLKKDFLNKLKTEHMLLVKGCPGTGKTTMSLAIADRFYEPTENKNFYLYYHNIKRPAIKSGNHSEKIWNGIKLLNSIPTVFIFDDIQGDIKLIKDLITYYKDNEFDGKENVFIIFIYKKTSVKDNEASEDTEDNENYEEEYSVENISTYFNGADIKLENNEALIKNIILKKKPTLKQIIDDKNQLTKICYLAGMDLVILDYIIGTVNTITDLANLKNDKTDLYKYVTRKYFKDDKWYDGVMKASCLAQYDIGITDLRYWKEITADKADEDKLEEFCTGTGGHGIPFCYYFPHSSLAELIYRSLVHRYNYNFTKKTAAILSGYFLNYIWDNYINEDLKRLLYNQLKIPETNVENKEIKKRFLAKYLPRVIEKQKHIDIIVLINILSRSDDETREILFNKIISDKLNINTIIEYTIMNKSSISHFPGTVSFLRKNIQNKTILIEFEKKIGYQNYLKLIKENGTFVELIRILQYSTPAMQKDIVDNITEEDIAALIEKTIESKSSIGTINLKLMKLKKNNIDNRILTNLEKITGYQNYLKLIKGNGTYIGLVGILAYSTPAMQKDIINNLTEEYITALIEKTIESKSSIGTIGLKLLDLKKNTIDNSIFTNLEKITGYQNYLKLIKGNGTFIELVGILAHSSPVMQKDIVNNLTKEYITALIEKTIESKSSIGTIGLKLMKLKKNNIDNSILANLEKITGYQNYLKLIKENGTFIELVGILAYSTSAMQKDTVKFINNNITTELINKGIKEKKSFGNIHWALREFQENNILDEFMETIETENLKDILIRSGYLGILPDIYQYIPPGKQGKLITLITSLTAEEKSEFTHNSSWTDMSISLNKLIYFKLEEVYKYYTSIINDYIMASNIRTEINHLYDLKEKINCLSLLSRFDQLSIDSLDTTLDSIILKEFIKTDNFLQLYSILLSVIAWFPEDFTNKQKIVHFAVTDEVINKIREEKKIKVIFWLLYNYFLLHYEKKNNDFLKKLHLIINTITDKMNNLCYNDFNPKGKCFYIALAGFLFYYNFITKETLHTLKNITVGISKNDFHLNFKYNLKDFISAFFYIKGVELIIDNKMRKYIVTMINPKLKYYNKYNKVLIEIQKHLWKHYVF